jgi:hypothetical protein
MANAYKLIEDSFKSAQIGQKDLLQFFDGKEG